MYQSKDLIDLSPTEPNASKHRQDFQVRFGCRQLPPVPMPRRTRGDVHIRAKSEPKLLAGRPAVPLPYPGAAHPPEFFGARFRVFVPPQQRDAPGAYLQEPAGWRKRPLQNVLR
jgi:hypothetical protein